MSHYIPKPGRKPASTELVNVRINFTTEEYQRLFQMAKTDGTKVATVIHEIVMDRLAVRP